MELNEEVDSIFKKRGEKHKIIIIRRRRRRRRRGRRRRRRECNTFL